MQTIHSRPYLVLTSLIAFSFFATVAPLQLLNVIWSSPPSSLKSAIILQMYLLTWILLVGAAVGVNNLHLGSMYLVTAWNLCAWLAAIVAVVEAIVRSRAGDVAVFNLVGETDTTRVNPEGHRFVRGVMYQPPEDDEDGDEMETDPTEITPLMQQQRRRSTGGREYVVGVDNELLLVAGAKPDGEYEEYGWWIVQMLALVPVPALLLFQITVMLQHSLMNTMADGSSPVTG